MEDIRVCPKCGDEMAAIIADEFCPKCGTPYGAEKPKPKKKPTAKKKPRGKA